MKGGALLDPKPLLDWIDANPGCIEGWAHPKSSEKASMVRRISAVRQPAPLIAAYGRVAQDESRRPRISFVVADHICCLIGVHMSRVYGRVYWTARVNELHDDGDDLDPDYEMDAAA